MTTGRRARGMGTSSTAPRENIKCPRLARSFAAWDFLSAGGRGLGADAAAGGPARGRGRGGRGGRGERGRGAKRGEGFNPIRAMGVAMEAAQKKGAKRKQVRTGNKSMTYL